MKMTRRVVSVFLSALLLAGALAGCAPQEGGEATPTPAATPTADPEPTVSADPSAEVPLVDTADVVEKLLGFSRDTAVMTIDGTPVPAENYLYCLSFATEVVAANAYGSTDAIEWDGTLEEVPVKDYITDSAMETVEFYTIIRAKAAELGVTISEDQRAELNASLSQVVSQLGGEEAYAQRLELLGMSDGAFRRLSEVNYLYDAIQAKLFSADNATEEELCRFAEEQADALMAKHILIKTVDDSNQSLPDEEVAAAKAKAEDLLAQLRDSDDPLTLFDELMNEYSEDGRDADGNLYSPDGYLFTANQMVAEFEAGTRALEYNQISDLVESKFGYHIILRLPPVNDEVRSAWVSVQMNDQVTAWVDAAQVETTEEFAAIDPQTYYEKLSAHRAEVEAAGSGGEETPDPTATPAE